VGHPLILPLYSPYTEVALAAFLFGPWSAFVPPMGLVGCLRPAGYTTGRIPNRPPRPRHRDQHEERQGDSTNLRNRLRRDAFSRSPPQQRRPPNGGMGR
jgi:hypothetical protein